MRRSYFPRADEIFRAARRQSRRSAAVRRWFRALTKLPDTCASTSTCMLTGAALARRSLLASLDRLAAWLSHAPFLLGRDSNAEG